MKICILIITALIGTISKTQDANVSYDQYLYNRVYKNIASFNIRNGNYSFNGVTYDSPFRVSKGFFYESILPDNGFKLHMVKKNWIGNTRLRDIRFMKLSCQMERFLK